MTDLVLANKFESVLRQLFKDFPDLQWFRNVHDKQIYLTETASYIASKVEMGIVNQAYKLTPLADGPILYFGWDSDGPWAFASNLKRSGDLSITWPISVEKQDHFMVAVLNTLLYQAGLMPKAESDVFRLSMGLSNCEDPAQEVVEWLKAHYDSMPERLREACDQARLHRM